MVTTRTLDVPGAHLSYEARDSGPVLVLTGAPMNAAHFAPLADALADEYTVVTHDPRGISGSTLDDPTQDSTPSCAPTTSPRSWTTSAPIRPMCSAAVAAR